MYTSVNWGDTTRLKTSSLGGFGPNDIVVMSFTVPSSPASYTTPGYTSMAEFNGPPTIRQATLSASACDFRPYDPTGANGPLMVSSGTQVTIDWNVGAPPISLVPGHTYYFNYRNYDTNKGGSSCSQSSCPAGFSTQWPR